MFWMFISQWFCISHVFISAISQYKLNWCKPSQTRAIQPGLCFTVTSTVACTARSFAVCRGAPQIDTVSSLWFWYFALLDVWEDSFSLILENFYCNETNEQFTRLPCLLCFLSPHVLATLTAGKPLRGPSGTGVLCALWHLGLPPWDTCLHVWRSGSEACPGQLVVVLPAVVDLD